MTRLKVILIDATGLTYHADADILVRKALKPLGIHNGTNPLTIITIS